MKSFKYLTMLAILVGHASVVQAEKPQAPRPSYFAEDDTVCQTGVMQSPIDITETTYKPMPKLNFIYQNVDAHIYNAKGNFYAVPDDRLVVELDGHRYSLIQYHAHNPGEHRFDNKTFPMEIHFVHRDNDGNTLVIAQMVKLGKRNDTFEDLLRHFAHAVVQVYDTNVVFQEDPSKLMTPNTDKYYSYEGSLTTPPCAEGIQWIVLKDTIEVSKAQIASFNNMVGMNSRIPQPLNGRPVYRSVEDMNSKSKKK